MSPHPGHPRAPERRTHPPPARVSGWAAALVLLAAASTCAGCRLPTRYERGELLREETRTLDAEAEHRISWVDHLDEEPPKLIVWVDSRETLVEEFRRVHRKVQVDTRRRLSLEPSFLLWPWNVIRTPVGLTGCAFSLSLCGGHYLAAGVGAVGGVVGTLAAWPWISLAHSWVGVGEPGSEALGMAGAMSMLLIASFELVLLPFDLPHTFIYGTPVFPVFANRREFPDEWLYAVEDCWRIAWGYKAYPPLPVWTRRVEERIVLPRQEIEGPWTRRTTIGDWQLGQVHAFQVSAPGWSREIYAANRMAEIDLRLLASELKPAETLQFTVQAQTPDGPLLRRFSYALAELGYPSSGSAGLPLAPR
jgi:hypothetical protein